MTEVKAFVRMWKKTSLEEIGKRKSNGRAFKMLKDKLERLKRNRFITELNKELIKEYVFYYRAHHSFERRAYILERLMHIARIIGKDFSKITIEDKEAIIKIIEEDTAKISKDYFNQDFEDFLDWLKEERGFNLLL